jgi:hypothetical protein
MLSVLLPRGYEQCSSAVGRYQGNKQISDVGVANVDCQTQFAKGTCGG